MTTRPEPRSSGSPASTRAGPKRLGIVAQLARGNSRGISTGQKLVSRAPLAVRTTRVRANAAIGYPIPVGRKRDEHLGLPAGDLEGVEWEVRPTSRGVVSSRSVAIWHDDAVRMDLDPMEALVGRDRGAPAGR